LHVNVNVPPIQVEGLILLSSRLGLREKVFKRKN
jgi:hypothetical protein